ncbi:hypothetical protein N9937_01385 [bacterium]|nr:hypothetical protein [bacterium]
MSNIFAPWVRRSGILPIVTGSGPVIGGVRNQHLWFDEEGAIYTSGGVITHYGASLPFDVDGRLVISGNPVVRWDQDTPFTESGAVAAIQAEPDYVDQGVAFLESGHISAGRGTPLEEPPEWSTVPDQTDLQHTLPQTFDASPYVSSLFSPITGYALIDAPAIFTIDVDGIITAEVGTAVGPHTLVVEATNSAGSSTASFTWTIVLGNAPTWDVIPNQSHRENALPKTLAVDGYVTSDSGPIDSIDLVTPPTGFSISGGVITAAAGTAVDAHAITVRATNGAGASDQGFTWNILEELLPPVWSPIPDQSHTDAELPVGVDVSPYVTSNAGPLHSWRLVTAPSGFTITASGVVNVAAGTAETAHSIVVGVSNDVGESGVSLNWTISDVLLPPQWGAIPAQNTSEGDLPVTLDTSVYVSSNDGALTGWQLVSPPAGFTIDGNGVITAEAGIGVGNYDLTVRVSNNSGTTSGDFSWTISSFFTAPQWSVIPEQNTEVQNLPVVLDVNPYVTSNSGSLTNWSLVSPPGGWTIGSSGLITVAAGRVVGPYSCSVRVSNDTGTGDSALFAWNILEEPLPPQWSTIPNRQDRENTLPQTYDVSSYASSNSGPLTGWSLVAPPAGFTISGAGVITAEIGIAVGIQSITVRVDNDEGSADSANFNWEIQEELLPPQWQTIPNQSDRVDTLPQQLDASNYVTTNNGTLFSWVINGPAGFTIDSAGLVTADGASVAVHTLSVQTSNLTGAATSDDFTWEVLEELLVPQWVTIPDRTDSEVDFPFTYSMLPYVTSNSGPLDTWSLVSPPSGFSIDQNGLITANGASPAGHSITVRVYNDEGAADKAFTWTIEATPQQSYYHEFNGAIAQWDYDHIGTVDVVDANNHRLTVPDGQPPYLGITYSGTTPVPNAGFEGLLLEKESTNELGSSEVYDTSDWSDVFLSFNGKEGTGQFSGSNNRHATHSIPYSVDYQLTGRFWGGDSGSKVFINYTDDVDGYLSVIVPAGVETDSIILSKTENRPSGENRPTFGVEDGGGDRVFFTDYMQAELGNYLSSYMKTGTGSTATRASSRCGQSFADMGINPNIMLDAHAGQIKFYARQHSDSPVDMHVMGLFGETENYFRIYYDVSAQRWSVVVRANNVEHFVHVPDTFVFNDHYNISWSRTPTRALKVWIDNVDVGEAAGTSAAWPPDVVTSAWIGSAYGTPTEARNMNGTIQSFRLVTGIVDDSVVAAWS